MSGTDLMLSFLFTQNFMRLPTLWHMAVVVKTILGPILVGEFTTHFRTCFSGDVHWGVTGLLTHGHIWLVAEAHAHGSRSYRGGHKARLSKHIIEAGLLRLVWFCQFLVG